MSGSTKALTFEELIVFIFLSIIVGQLKSSWVTSSQMISEIREGIINKYLIRPISYFWYNFMMFVGVNSLYIIVYMSLLVLFVFIYPGILFNSLISIAGFIISLLLSIYLSYCIYFIMACFAFWFGEVRAIVVAYNLTMLVLSGQYIPIRLFPESIIKFMEITPFIYLVDFPVSIATGRMPIELWIINFICSIGWCVIMWIIGILIYNRGIRQYEAYGS